MDLFDKCKHDKTMATVAKEKGIYPYFHELQTRQDTQVIMEGQRRIMLGSNNYLGLTVDEDIIAAGVAALQQYGTGCSGSRFLNGTLQLHTELEKELAEFVGKQACMTFSTGFQSNLGIISAIAGREDVVFCDRENHASIYDGCRLSYAQMVRYRHSDMEELEKKLAQTDEKYGKLIITDGVFSMGGDICKLPQIVALAEKYGARVMVDDAHGLGVLGKTGAGTAEYFGLTDKVDIIMGTFSKSLASLGGYMAADAEVIEFVRHASRPFIFCASIPPSCCATALAALRKLKAHPELPKRLAELSNYARAGMTKRGIPFHTVDATPIIPIMTGDPIRTLVISKQLYEKGVYINPVLPPAAPSDGCLLRTSYMASLTEALIDEALDVIAEVVCNFDDSCLEAYK